MPKPATPPFHPIPTTSRARRTTAGLAAAALAVSIPVIGNAGSAAAAPSDVTVKAMQAVTLVSEGGTATVAVRVTTEGGAPLADAVSVDYKTANGTATAGSDYTGATGTLTFAAGTESGATQDVAVNIADADGAEEAETISVVLSTESAGATVAGTAMVVVNANGMDYLDSDLPVGRRVRDLLGHMTLADKVGQMTQAERGRVFDNPAQITELRLGSVLSGGGSTPPQNTPTGWAEMVDEFQRNALATPLQIPLIYGIDSVHGNGNLAGATVFPHNIGLGATRNTTLVRRIQHAVARETRAVGIPWTFAPCVCVARDDRWGRTYESFGERPGLAGRMGAASVIGFQGPRVSKLDNPGRILATAKHFAGDGDTEYGTGEGGDGLYSIDQGLTITSRARFERIDLAPYLPALRQQVGSIMPSYSSVDFTEDGVGNPVEMHQHKPLLTGWLKEEHGFDGFIISDWEGIHQNAGSGHAVRVRRAINAGVDMAMEPYDPDAFEADLTSQVQQGYVPMSRINDAVRRILTKKFELGLFEKPFARRGQMDSIRSDKHLELARRAAAQSQVLLKNKGGVLPLEQDAKIYVAGRNANNIGNQAGGWTLQWQGVPGADVIPGNSILEGMQQVAPGADITFSEDASAPMAGNDVGVVVVGETPYAEGFGDVGGPNWPYGASIQAEENKSLKLQEGDRAVINDVCSALPKCVVLVVSGRPQIVTKQLPKMDALVASWLPGSQGEGVADVLFGERAFQGKLSVSWPRTTRQEPINVGDENYDPLFAYGFGLTTERTNG